MPTVTNLSLPARKKLIETDLLANFKKTKLVEYKVNNQVYIKAIDYYETKEVKQNQIDYLSQIPLIDIDILSETLKRFFFKTNYGTYEGKDKDLAREYYVEEAYILLQDTPVFALEQATENFIKDGFEDNKMPAASDLAKSIKFYARNFLKAKEVIQSNQGEDNLPLPKDAQVLKIEDLPKKQEQKRPMINHPKQTKEDEAEDANLLTKEENFLLEVEALQVLSDIRSGKEKTFSREDFFKALREKDENRAWQEAQEKVQAHLQKAREQKALKNPL